MNLLLNEPSVVLGNVSMATAETLQKRLDAEVIASSPKNDCYTIKLLLKDDRMNNEIVLSLRNAGYSGEINNDSLVTDLTYKQAHSIWNRYHKTNAIALYNQSYQRDKIILEDFDKDDTVQTDFLINEIGMPQDALEVIHQNLPVVLDESLNQVDVNEKLKLYEASGLTCAKNKIPFGKYKIEVNNINDPKKFEEIVSQFYKDIEIEKDIARWTAPLPLDSILNRFLEKQLEYIGCEVTHQYEAA